MPEKNQKKWLLWLAVLMVGCSSTKVVKQPDYAQAVMSRTQPPNDEARVHECAWVMSEILRQQGGLGYASSLEAGSPGREEAERSVRNNIGVLQARARAVGCGAPATRSR